ncbi:hypothetical protein JCM19237_3695 [Photobacterium aphoticum]|uniref:Uncharacterized protein n=1 Tax=Photobacterium aphoticum TaxID=754436 RepID=A0A090RCJ8_9GAMM|nr:hypothetical protein JCM19237_3695 [Photobacterium aphoticum]
MLPSRKVDYPHGPIGLLASRVAGGMVTEASNNSHKATVPAPVIYC